MIYQLTELLSMLDYQVREGERQIARQLAIIELLEGLGRDTTEAKELLLTFHKAMESHISHRDRVRTDLARLTKYAGS